VRRIGLCWQWRGALDGRCRSYHWSLDGGASRGFSHTLLADAYVWPYFPEHGNTFVVVQLVRYCVYSRGYFDYTARISLLNPYSFMRHTRCPSFSWNSLCWWVFYMESKLHLTSCTELPLTIFVSLNMNQKINFESGELWGYCTAW